MKKIILSFSFMQGVKKVFFSFLILFSGVSIVYGQGDELNAIIQNGEKQGNVKQTPSLMPSNQPTKGKRTPVNSQSDNKEIWIKRNKAIENLQIISTHPLPGESCKQVIFDLKPGLNKSYDVKNKLSLPFDLQTLCLISFRNASTDRSIVLRIGHAIETLSISVNQKIFTGIELRAGQKIVLPLRTLKVGKLMIPLEVVWLEDIFKKNVFINKANIVVRN